MSLKINPVKEFMKHDASFAHIFVFPKFSFIINFWISLQCRYLIYCDFNTYKFISIYLWNNFLENFSYGYKRFCVDLCEEVCRHPVGLVFSFSDSKFLCSCSFVSILSITEMRVLKFPSITELSVQLLHLMLYVLESFVLEAFTDL